MTEPPDLAARDGNRPAAPPSVPPPPPPAPGTAAAPGGWSAGPTTAGRPPAGPRSTSGRTSVAVLGIVLGVVVGANAVNAALPLPANPELVNPGPALPVEPQPTADGGQPQPGETTTPIRTSSPGSAPAATRTPVDPGPVAAGEGVAVGGGFVLFPPAGWTSVGDESGIVLQKGAVLVIVAGFPWEASAVELAALYRDAWFAGGEFTGDEPQSGEVGDAIPAAGLSYTGVWNGAQVDGAIVTAAIDGSGLVLNVVGPSGSLTAVSDDLDLILGTVQHAGG